MFSFMTQGRQEGPDYYDILGIERNSTESEIKKSYRKLAMKWHPDKNPKNKEEAEKKFKEISKAYNILGNTSKRSAYDKFGISEDIPLNNGSFPFPDNFEFPFPENFDFPFKNSFNFSPPNSNRSNTKNEENISKIIDIKDKLNINLVDAYLGSCIEYRYNRNIRCKVCNGDGVENSKSEKDINNLYIKCNVCDGLGYKIQIKPNIFGMVDQLKINCNICHTSGKIIKPGYECSNCNGECCYKVINKIKINIEKGVQENDKIILKKKGHFSSIYKKDGDLILHVKVNKNNEFKRIGNHLFLKKKIDLRDALIGLKCTIEHMDLHKIKIDIDSIIEPGSSYVIRNEGMPIYKTEKKGDLIINFEINFPEKLSENRKKYLGKILPGNDKVCEGEDVDIIGLTRDQNIKLLSMLNNKSNIKNTDEKDRESNKEDNYEKNMECKMM